MQSRHLTHELGLVDITGANLWTSDQSGLSTKLPDLKDQCIFLVDSRWSTISQTETPPPNGLQNQVRGLVMFVGDI